MKPRIKFAQFKKALIAKVVHFSRNAFLRQASMFDKCASHLNHNFAMRLFNNQVRKNLGQNNIKSFTSKLNIVNLFFKFSSSISGFKLLVVGSSKLSSNPLHHFLISITDFYVGMIVGSNISRSRLSIKNSDEETTFSINKACEISKIGFIIKHVSSYLRPYYHELNYVKSLP